MSRDDDFLFWNVNVNERCFKIKKNPEMIRYQGVVCPMVFVFICCLISFSDGQHKYNVVVNTRHGAVEGFTIPSQYSAYHNRRINVFLGIPYAKRLTQYLDWRREFRFNVCLYILNVLIVFYVSYNDYLEIK